ncbi:antitoxin of toxin-antitoxin stability system [Pseudomonas protegens]|uniref:antitoxin of toxin-antitoxin stability system n=1 Tax=Pseudomonas protegens TaxID=380021 RepID=UPI000F4CBE69|nr:antitoxin of toxin-antitoxin stability system [Pseudomonas protegens]ROL76943.1 antitoxin of toxin-antitoxin stability system [Pseudomonas protegens]
MPKHAVFTMKLETELRDQFMAQAQACHRPASQIIREMMRDFVQKQHESREYEAFLQQKVQLARASLEAQHGHSHEEIEAEFAARRARASRLE